MIEMVGRNQVSGARIKVVGVGGGGGNAVNTMIAAGLTGVDFIAANTDGQALDRSLCAHRIQLGKKLTGGRGAGAKPEVGREAALEDEDVLRECLSDAEMVFVTAGMGGGTGTGGAPVIARIARKIGALTVAVVTKPFDFEGRKRMRNADDGISSLKEAVDAIITIPNQRLLAISNRETSMIDTFKQADEVLLHAVRGISDLVTVPGLMNLDFADVQTVMSGMGVAMMGAGVATGENRAVEAAQRAISSPLLDDISIRGARGVLINVTGGLSMSLSEASAAASLIQAEADEDAEVIFGAVVDESVGEEFRITVIATGFSSDASEAVRPAARRYTEPAPQPERGREFGVLNGATPSGRGHIADRIPRDRDSDRPRVSYTLKEDADGNPVVVGGAPKVATPTVSIAPCGNVVLDDGDPILLDEDSESGDDYAIPAFLRKSAG